MPLNQTIRLKDIIESKFNSKNAHLKLKLNPYDYYSLIMIVSLANKLIIKHV